MTANEKPARCSRSKAISFRSKKIGNSVGLILPKDLLARLKLKEGDKLHVVEQTERGFQAQPVRSEAREGDGNRAAFVPEICRHATRRWRNDRAAMNGSKLRHRSLIFMPSNWRSLAAPTAFAIWAFSSRLSPDLRTRFAYGETDLAVLAAAYGFGIARNHPFIDGNKRTALASMIVFLRPQRTDLDAPQAGGDRNDARSGGRRDRRRRARALDRATYTAA